MSYLRRAHADNVVRAEIFLGMQNFTLRGIAVSTVMSGVLRAADDAVRDFGISTGLMVGVQRHRPEAAAFDLLEQIMPWSEHIIGIGLGGAEVGNPPSRFQNFFRTCREAGFHILIHAGEEGPAAYVREALELIGADRIDHGNACVGDSDLVREIAARQVPLTLCPISNLKLNVIASLERHPIRTLMDAGVRVTINSDDPSYFGGYINDNFLACQDALRLTRDEVVAMARNSFLSAFIAPTEKQRYLALLDDYVAGPGSSGV